MTFKICASHSWNQKAVMWTYQRLRVYMHVCNTEIGFILHSQLQMKGGLGKRTSLTYHHGNK